MSDTFAADLRKFAERTNKSLDDICRGVAIKWFSSTVMSTPVDTGRLRGNWLVSQGSPITAELARFDKSGSIVQGEIVQSVGGVGTVNYLVNNLPYAERIEYDCWSNQAPSGMVRVNFARIKAIISEVAAGNAV